MQLLNQQQIERVTAAVDGLNPTQLAWLGGYFSGLSAQPSNSQTLAAVQQNPSQLQSDKTTVLFGSQTGNSKKIAENLYTQLQQVAGEVSLKNLSNYRPQQLKKEQKVVVVISTHGNGEPPDEALAFYKYLRSERAPKLAQLEFAVLGLGDSSYDHFCQTGVDIDAAFEKLGAKRFHPRIDVDLDYEEDVENWQNDIVKKTSKPDTVVEFTPKQIVTDSVAQHFSETNPYQAEILSSIELTTTESEQHAYHIEFALEAAGLNYQAGDILAIIPENQDELVNAIIDKQAYSPEAPVLTKKGETSLHTALKQQLEISNLTQNVVKSYASFVQSADLNTLIADKNALTNYLNGADLLDLISDYPGNINPQDLCDSLRPLLSRQYSIASSENIHEGEVHILLKPVSYTLKQPSKGSQAPRQHYGVASNWITNKQVGETVPVYIKPNSGFKLPAGPNDKIIMIGAGTGVAPFRSFLYEREHQGANGNSWLFFGEQRFSSDFLYQTEWQQFLKTRVLERMNVAFSRDQKEKTYVQHKLQEQAVGLYEWIEQGATIYVCGDMHHLAKDVHSTLINIIAEQGNKTAEAAAEQLDQMKASKKYQRDVY